MEVDDSVTFYDLGLCPEMVDACDKLGWKYPTPIQAQTIQLALEGKHICGTAETGSGKTGAYLLPLVHNLLENPCPFFGLIFAPTRELVIQIYNVCRQIGSDIGLRSFGIIGGVNEKDQVKALATKPHIVVATPGRLMQLVRDHPDVFMLENVKYLVFDEADVMLEGGTKLNDIVKILEKIPKERLTMLFSATMPDEIKELEKIALTNPSRISLTKQHKVAKTLTEYLCISKTGKKEASLVSLLKQYNDKTTIVFVSSRKTAQIIAKLLDSLDIKTTFYHGDLPQRDRNAAIENFRAGKFRVLVATNVGSRGLDVPSVDVIINYELPDENEEYIHRVGRAGRAERSGIAITLITMNEAPRFYLLESFLKRKLQVKHLDEAAIDELGERVEIARRLAVDAYKEYRKKKTKKFKERHRDQ